VPRTCDAPESAKLLVKNKSDDTKDGFGFTFKGAAPLEVSAFGAPLTTTAFTTCLYYDSTLVASMLTPASATRWVPYSKGRGWKYGDRAASEAGITKMRLQAGAAGDARQPKLLVKGQGLNLPDPTVPVPGSVTSVTVQITSNTNTTCFGATFTSPFQSNKANAAGTSAVFKAKR